MNEFESLPIPPARNIGENENICPIPDDVTKSIRLDLLWLKANEIQNRYSNLFIADTYKLDSSIHERMLEDTDIDKTQRLYRNVWMSSSKISQNLMKYKKYYGKNYSTRVIPWYIEHGYLDTYVIPDRKSAESRIGQWELVTLEQETDIWMMDPLPNGIGEKSQDTKRYGESLLALRPEAQKVLVEIIHEFQERLKRDYGDNIHVRVILNSLLRNQKYNATIWGASEYSAHTRWIGIDISDCLFEIDGVLFTSKANMEEFWHITNVWVVNNLSNLLINILKDFDDVGKIILTEEGSHPHITVISQ